MAEWKETLALPGSQGGMDARSVEDWNSEFATYADSSLEMLPITEELVNDT